MEDLKKNLESWELYEKQRNTLDEHINGAHRLEDLKKNLESWELYEKQRNTLDEHIDGAQKEFEDTCRVYNLEADPKDYVGLFKIFWKSRPKNS